MLDSLIKRFSDPSEFPNVNTIVVSGHSMGGQMVHRYAMLGLAQPTNPKVQISFAIMNPGSLLWVDEARPRSVKECPDYNDYVSPRTHT